MKSLRTPTLTFKGSSLNDMKDMTSVK